jgi:hypothetical protein
MTRSKKRATQKAIAHPSAPSAESNAVMIVRIKLQELFGLYTYDIPAAGMTLDRTPLLYGENGLGKTNILRILFHLLSSAGDRGHRTALGKIKFRRAEVFLSNAIVVSASRGGDSLEGALRLEVRKEAKVAQELLGAWDWYPQDAPEREASQKWLTHINPDLAQTIAKAPSAAERTKVLQTVFLDYIAKESNPLVSEEAFLRALREHIPPVFFLTSDRTLSSDKVDQVAFVPSGVDPRSMRPDIMVAKGREGSLNQAIALASRHLSHLGLRATRQGSRSMHSIYHDLIKRLASRANKRAPRAPQSLADLVSRLLDLSSRYDLYAKYGLAPNLHGPSLVSLLGNVRPADRSVAAEVLRPYVESLAELANSFAQAYAVIDTFVTVVNGFLYDKSVEFSVGEGMLVRNKLGAVLKPQDLSSGEQQLLLLFCHIVLAHDSGGIFIIDEPEMSLNIKWQRRLLDALARLDTARNLQFVLASHSLEILSRHRESVVPLSETVNE